MTPNEATPQPETPSVQPQIVAITATPSQDIALDTISAWADRQNFAFTVATYSGQYEGSLSSASHGVARIDELDPAKFTSVVFVGGPSVTALRGDADVLELVAEIYHKNGVIAALGEGPQVLISAEMSQRINLVRDRFVTGVPGIVDDLVNAGGIFEDVAAVNDESVVTGRDLRHFLDALDKAVTVSSQVALFDNGNMVAIQ